MSSWLRRLLTLPLSSSPVASLDELRRLHADAATDLSHSVERAALGGVVADRTGFAFACGYQEALLRLLPQLPRHALVSLCATEEGGAHPRAIQTSLDENGRLRGRKVFATLATAADVLMVVASTGTDENGRNRLRLVRVDAHAAGVRIQPLPPTSFAPEIPHAVVELDGVNVRPDDVLPGDGYDAYLKPFRTVEDLHVLAALHGYLVGVARRHRWPEEGLELLCASLVGLHALGDLDAAAPETHVALAGAFTATRNLLATLEPRWDLVDEETRTRWKRDARLLNVAETARTQRRERAWSSLRS
ncbi:MAG: acyl-CoA dehydrogenase family protein [Myxococcota bacterium]